MEAAVQKKNERNEEKSQFGLCPKILSQWWCSWGVWETTSYTPIKLKMFVSVTDAPGSVSVRFFENHRALIQTGSSDERIPHRTSYGVFLRNSYFVMWFRVWPEHQRNGGAE